MPKKKKDKSKSKLMFLPVPLKKNISLIFDKRISPITVCRRATKLR